MNKILQRIAASPGFYQYDNPQYINMISAVIKDHIINAFLGLYDSGVPNDYKDYPNLHGKVKDECYCGAIGYIKNPNKLEENYEQVYAELYVKYTNNKTSIKAGNKFCIGVCAVNIDTGEVLQNFADFYPEVDINLAKDILNNMTGNGYPIVIDYFFT